MKLIIFGPPGSGKGTYAQRVCPKLGIAKISTGDIFRSIAKGNDDFAKRIAKILESGQLVDDETAIKIFKERASQPDAKNGYMLDGFPRTIFQAKFLDSFNNLDAIINIIAPKEILIEKALARRICSNPKCDGNYNLADIRKTIDGVNYFLPPLLPKNDNVCDKCGSSLYHRNDDNKETIELRSEVYEKQSKPIIEHYKNKGTRFIDIHMNRPPEEIVERILDEIRKVGLK